MGVGEIIAIITTGVTFAGVLVFCGRVLARLDEMDRSRISQGKRLEGLARDFTDLRGELRGRRLTGTHPRSETPGDE